jgi:hypothetical protein
MIMTIATKIRSYLTYKLAIAKSNIKLQFVFSPIHRQDDGWMVEFRTLTQPTRSGDRTKLTTTFEQSWVEYIK